MTFWVTYQQALANKHEFVSASSKDEARARFTENHANDEFAYTITKIKQITEEEHKQAYVSVYLAPAMIMAGRGIKKVEYRLNERSFTDDKPPYAMHFTEELVVWYDEWYYKTVNIEGDSPSGIFCDLVRQGIF